MQGIPAAKGLCARSENLCSLKLVTEKMRFFLVSIRTTRSAKNTALQKSRNEVSASPAMLHCNSLTFARIFCLGALHSRNFSVTQAHTELG
jgi:hypothetical protein